MRRNPSHTARVPGALLSTALLLLLALPHPVLAADANKPHDHRGVLKPYPEKHVPVSLSDAEKKQIADGKPVFKKTEGDTGGRGTAIFQVNAPPDVVWDVLKSFESYPKWIKNVDQTEVYRKKGENIDVRFKISAVGFSVEYFIAHTFREAEKYATWTLDYDRESDLGDSVGYWKVDPVEGNPDASLVTYSVDIQIKSWVPGFIRTLLVDNGLKDATSWVKKVSEQRAAAKKK
jgi:ribosome-associated toxin RatA of RatAB toxin-antitoxin module